MHTSTLKKIARDMLAGKLPVAAKEDLVKQRLEVCKQCPEFTKLSRQCKLCGCFMDLKAKILEAECPQNLW